MNTHRRAVWSAALVVAFLLFSFGWANLGPQIEAEVALEQMKNDDGSYAVGRAAANANIEGFFLLITVMLLLALWLPVAFTALNRAKKPTT